MMGTVRAVTVQGRGWSLPKPTHCHCVVREVKQDTGLGHRLAAAVVFAFPSDSSLPYKDQTLLKQVAVSKMTVITSHLCVQPPPPLLRQNCQSRTCSNNPSWAEENSSFTF